MDRGRSGEMYEKTKKVTPGGVSSPVRRFDPYPIFFDSGSGCNIKDIDGNDYIDLCMAYGPLILGHSPERVISAVKEQLSKGTVFGAPSLPEYELIEAVRKRVPCAEMVRLANSGTEATMHAIRLARGYTSRNTIVKTDSGFHGSHDSVLIKNNGNYRGVPSDTSDNTKQVQFNDISQLDKVLSKEDVAAVIIEPVQGNMGIILPEKGYLEAVRKTTEQYGTVLIFDEVITGFRLAAGGAQEIYGVTPDMATYGKIMGGGFPIGALAGKRRIMELAAPAGDVYMAGTFSGNPVTATAGVAALTQMSENNNYDRLNRNTATLLHAIRDSLTDRKINASLVGTGSMFQVFFGIEAPRNSETAKNADTKLYGKFFRSLLDLGIYLPPSQFEVNFTSLAHDPVNLKKVSDAFDTALKGLVG
ncbi:MAG: glutamate-1-semialdehyde 2,1-aminomutase [Candidatus Methanoplasma sp.]|jgi:glutamate-1-semialdehyde 2,1-aminomutase|nr:glutamate-1-semialdehyde 2,1-aminomutase [Candidatus Methanoplasma sp.]